MKIKGLIVAALVFFVLGGILYWSDRRKPSQDAAKLSADTPPVILKLDETAIIRVELKKKNAGPIVLAKTPSANWQITAPKPVNADQSAVSGILSTLSSLTSERVVEEKTSNLKQFGLDQPALEVDITGKENKTQQLLLGDDTPTGSAVYAMLAGNPRVYMMPSYAKTSLDKTLNDLRDKRLLTLASDNISRIELIRKGQTIELGRNKDDWQILKPKPMRADSFQVGELVQKLADAKMDLSGSDDKGMDSGFAHATPVVIAKVTDQSGTQELQIRKNKDTYCAKSSLIDGTYKVVSDLGKTLDKSLNDLRNKKLFDFGFSDPSKIELHNGTKAYFLTRSGVDWWSNGKKMDAATVQSLISKLRDLTASKFPDSGFANPTIDVSVTSDDGKRIEKILMAKSADGYIAKRENEPALYQLDSSSVDDLQRAADEIKPAPTAPTK